MAYDQGQYQAASRPYNGRAAAPPAQAYNQNPSYNQYGGQGQGQYDQYAQDDGYAYSADGYDSGYGQQEYGHQQSQSLNGDNRGGGGRGPSQNNGYGPPQGQNRGGPDPRGGGRPAPGQQGRGYNGGRGGGPPSRGGRPSHPERSASADPSQQRRPPPNQPRSPQDGNWDNSFPGNKKPSMSEDHRMANGMANMNINGPPRPRTAGGSRPDGSRRPPPPGDGYGNGRPAGDGGRPPPRGPPGSYSSQGGPSYGGQRPPPDQAHRGPPPRQNTYNNGPVDQGYGQPKSPIRDDFAPPPRSMTMPNDINGYDGGQQPAPRYPVGDVGPSAPYNGPVGRMPPRPATSNSGRPPPQRPYAQDPPAPAHQQQQYLNAGTNSGNEQNSARGSISDLYDDYFQDDAPGDVDGHGSMRSGNAGFDNTPNGANGHPRGTSIDGPMAGGGSMPPRQQVNGNQAMNRMKSQPDFRAQVQPQSAVYEMAGDAPSIPDSYDQSYDQQQYDQYNTGPQNGPRGQNGNGYSDYNQGGQQGYGQGRGGAPPGRGTPNGAGSYNGVSPRANSLPKQQPYENGLPSHPPPVRAGLVQGSVANLANNKPPPVRNYGNPNGPVAANVGGPPPQHQNQPPQQQQQQRQSLSQAEVPPPVTLDELERLKTMAHVNPNDGKTQLLLAKKWVEAADVLTPQIPDSRARSKARERYMADAHKMLKKLCAGPQPLPDAQFFLADCHGRGAFAPEPDNKEAFLLYQAAAKAGHAAAAYRTAVCCEIGSEEGGGTRKDPLKAIQWYKRAATLGDTPAMYKMGMILLKGLLGLPKDTQQAVGWLKRAADSADAENPHALHELGLLYEAQQPPDKSGVIVRDEGYALSLFTQSADLGYKFSQFRLGCAYEYGLMGCPISPRDSIMWYSRAAVQEEHQSELALSGWYLTGSEGVLGQSDTEAYLWARKAAMAGLAKAEYAMGYFTEVGIGSPSDLEGAKRWYWRAAAQNFPKARERLEDLKRGGSKPQLKSRERISRSKVGKQNEGECSIM